jgi:hypothetical protein
MNAAQYKQAIEQITSIAFENGIAPAIIVGVLEFLQSDVMRMATQKVPMIFVPKGPNGGRR